MKIALYYFSGTGNSLAVAKYLASELQENIEVIPIAKLANEKIIYLEHDIIGIIYPAWLHHVPPIVEDFLAKLIINEAYIFSICTYAINPSNSLFDINMALEQKGGKLAAGFLIAMGGKYILLKDITFSDEENQRRFSEAKKKVIEIAKIIKEKKHCQIEGCFDENETGQLIDYHRNVYKVHEQFRVTEACILCGQCVKICPKNNVEIVESKVVWKDNCDYCLACLHWCPSAAIQNGKITPACKRYHHPDISITDITQR